MYYVIQWADRPGVLGLARPLNERSEADRKSERRLRQPGVVEDWVDEEYELTGPGGFGDYQPEVRGFRLLSDRFRRCLDEVRTDADDVQWLPAWVRDQGGERRRYWLLHFPEPWQSVAKAGSVSNDVGAPGNGALDLEKVRERHVMPTPTGSYVRCVISQKALDAMKKAGIEGVEVRPQR